MAELGPDDAAPDLGVLQVLTAAGWGFYRVAARQRADDQMVRGLACEALARAVEGLARLEAQARAAIPAPSRAAPVPDAGLLAAARGLKAARERVAGLEARVRGASAPPDGDSTTLALSAAQVAALVRLDAALVVAARGVEAGVSEAAIAAVERVLVARAGLVGWR